MKNFEEKKEALGKSTKERIRKDLIKIFSEFNSLNLSELIGYMENYIEKRKLLNNGADIPDSLIEEINDLKEVYDLNKEIKVLAGDSFSEIRKGLLTTEKGLKDKIIEILQIPVTLPVILVVKDYSNIMKKDVEIFYFDEFAVLLINKKGA